MLTKFKLFFHTMRHLQPRQLLYFFLYRKFGFFKVDAVEILSGRSRAKFSLQAPLEQGPLNEAQCTFTFLNVRQTFDLLNLNWRPESSQRLWLYHLHYFDYLRQLNVSESLKDHLIEDWIAQNPQGSEPAWEPYTVSLRIVNWVMYFCQKSAIKPEWQAKLFEQSCWLRRNLELHILANHYFENLKALAFSCVYFQGLGEKCPRNILKWQPFVLWQLSQQLDEQFLPDGGHYERSPQYHSLLIKDCIELYRLFSVNTTPFDSLLPKLKDIIERGCTVLKIIENPQSAIPLFNDSTLGEAHTLRELKNQAQGLPLLIPDESSAPIDVIALEDFGIYGVKTEGDSLMIDCGEIGPSYQPGHTHCDFLSYELMINSHLLVVDSGVLEYEPGPRRQQMRSTRAHNTVMVGGVEQSQIWGEFRVAKRAKKLFASINQNGNDITFKGAYSGFFDIPGGASHSRDIKLTLESQRFRSIEIKDEIRLYKNRPKKKPYDFESFIHFHPDLKITRESDFTFILTTENESPIRLKIFSCIEARIENSIYSPDFGIALENKTLVLKSEVQSLRYIFEI